MKEQNGKLSRDEFLSFVKAVLKKKSLEENKPLYFEYRLSENGEKEKFLNPIMQNKLHIRCLNEYLKEEYPIYSVIAFSQRCELKKIELVSDNAVVIKRNDITKVLAKNSKYSGQLSEKAISEIYEKLYPLTQVGEEVKKQHIENIKNEKNLKK